MKKMKIKNKNRKSMHKPDVRTGGRSALMAISTYIYIYTEC